MSDDGEVLFRNEFAMVGVQLLVESDAVVLRIRNVDTDETIDLDPLELESLTRMRHGQFGPLIVFDDIDQPDS